MKKRVITAIILWLILAGVVLPPVVADFHALLSRQRSALTIKPWVGWRVILSGELPLRIYLLSAALCALGVLWAVVSSTYINYKSGMIQVTPDIATPAPAGQGQYGTARWLATKQIPRYYGVALIQRDNLQELLAAGQKDFEEVEKNAKNSNVG